MTQKKETLFELYIDLNIYIKRNKITITIPLK